MEINVSPNVTTIKVDDLPQAAVRQGDGDPGVDCGWPGPAVKTTGKVQSTDAAGKHAHPMTHSEHHGDHADCAECEDSVERVDEQLKRSKSEYVMVDDRTVNIRRIQAEMEYLLGDLFRILDMSIVNKQQHTAMKAEIISRVNAANSNLRQVVFQYGEEESGHQIVARFRGR